MIIPLLISAFLYSISFIVPSLWASILFFIVPLHKFRLTFYRGFLWGIIAFSTHASGILYAALRMQEGPWAIRIIPSFCIIIYLALHAGLWFIALEKSKTLTCKCLYTLFISPFINTIFFWYLCYGCFWPLYNFEGYPFANPLLPLVTSDGTKMCIMRIGFLGSLFILFLFSELSTLITRRSHALLCSLFLICSLFIPFNTQYSLPNFVSLVIPFTTQFSSSKNSLFPLECVYDHILSQPHKKIVISPESAFYCHTLLSDESLKLFNTPGVAYILGSFSQNAENIYNTLYHVGDGTLKNTHHKQHTVLTEQIPAWLQVIPQITQYYKTGFFIERAPVKHDIWYLEDVTFEPYTCSELFCHYRPLHPLQHNTTILLCCNDSWFTGWTHYAAHLMISDACFKAVLWHKDILYIGYQNALFISSQGHVSKIPQ